MTGQADLERGYRQLLACYPKAFRRENEQEILAVLMASAREGQRRPGLAETADLTRSALRMRLRPGGARPPRTVFTAVRLMYVGAAVELVALITLLATLGSLKSAIAQSSPGFTAAHWHAIVLAHIVPDEVAASIAIGLWLWMAWANGRGRGWARVVFTVFFGLSSLSLLSALAQGAAVYATADLITGIALWLIELAALMLIFNKESGPFYRHSATPAAPTPSTASA